MSSASAAAAAEATAAEDIHPIRKMTEMTETPTDSLPLKKKHLQTREQAKSKESGNT